MSTHEAREETKHVEQFFKQLHVEKIEEVVSKETQKLFDIIKTVLRYLI